MPTPKFEVGDIVEYVGNDFDKVRMNPAMIGSVGVITTLHGNTGADVEWIVCTNPCLGKSVKGEWYFHNLKKL